MATKTANLSARIEPQVKISAEAILETLGIPVSTAINMFYIQIILNNGLPFDAKLPGKLPLSLSNLSEEDLQNIYNYISIILKSNQNTISQLTRLKMKSHSEEKSPCLKCPFPNHAFFVILKKLLFRGFYDFFAG